MEDKIFRFDEYELDASQRELRQSEEQISLEPRAFDLLLYLVRHRDRAVGKDELQDAVWPGMMVTETALTRAVMKARKAVGDDASRQLRIKTIHGHGYRFIATAETESDTPLVSKQEAGLQKNGTGRPWVVRILAVVIAVGALIGLWLAYSPPQAPVEMRIAVLPLHDTSHNPDLAWMQLGLMSLASNTLAAGGDFPVVDDGNVAGLASSLEWDGDIRALEGSELLDSLRRVYGATHIVAMELINEGAMLRLNFVLVDEQDETWRGTMVGRDAIELTHGVVQSVYGRLAGKARLSGNPVFVSEDPFNNEAFARGMDYSLEGRCAEAVPFFRLIAEQEPALFAPRLELASCLRILGEPAEAEALLQQLISEQTRLGNAAALAQSQMVLGIVQNRTGRLNGAESSYQAALASSMEAGDPDLTARITHNLAILAKNRGDWAASGEYLDRAMLEYQRAGREIMPGQLWSGYANLNMEQGQLNEANEFLVKALDAFRASGDRRNEAMMLNNTGYLRRQQGRWDEAEDYHLQSLAIREQLRDRVGIGRTHSMLATVYSKHGNYKQALASATSALTIARETGDRLFEGTSLAQLAAIELAMDRGDLARAHYLEARAILESFQDSMRILQLDIRLARMDLAAGQPDAAAAAALATLAAAREGEFIQPEIDALVLLGDANLAADRVETAMDYYQQALLRVRATDLAARETFILIKLAEAHLNQDQIDAAAPLIAALARQESTSDSLQIQARYAWLRGDSDLAIRHMSAAREQAGNDWSDSSEAQFLLYQGRKPNGN